MSELSAPVKTVGVINKLGKWGRMVVPGAIRRHMGWEEGTSLEFLVVVQNNESVAVMLREVAPPHKETKSTVDANTNVKAAAHAATAND